jgi:hypothetical protein
VAGEPVVGDLRVQVVERGDGTREYTIVWPDGACLQLRGVVKGLFVMKRGEPVTTRSSA